MWITFGASVIGTSHARLHQPCQDAHGYETLESGVIAAVADGLGSAAHSEKGALLAVHASLSYLTSALQTSIPVADEEREKLLFQAFETARAKLVTTSDETGIDLRDYATTLLVAIITEEWVGIGQIGDGEIIVLDKDGTMLSLSPRLEREYINQVAPLTAENALSIAHVRVRHGCTKALAMLSDGLQALSINYSTGEPFAPFFTPLFEGICRISNLKKASGELAKFLSSERVCRRTNDDKTIVIVGKCTDIQ